MKSIEEFYSELKKARPEIDSALLLIKQSIENPATKPTAKRSLTIKVTFTPEEDRSTCHYEVEVKPTLPSLQSHSSSVVIGEPKPEEPVLFEGQPEPAEEEED
ncbi:hypothetical protein [Leptospira phage LE4]|uniref:Uncharacterized protein n=1 Tax=Leptospira phage LE4 TaxID=2041383 RepID=A0A343LEB5_9CAUD|nr:replication terminator [Leptospira phage LE4]ATN95025.1 hypothetical protein [Leptospira phage LE4]